MSLAEPSARARAQGDLGPILDALVRAATLDAAAARRAHAVAQATHESVVAVLHQLALVDDAIVARAAADCFKLRLGDVATAPSTPLPLDGLSPNFLRRHRLLPLGWSGENIIVGVVDPTVSEGLAAVAFAARKAAEPQVLAYGAWRQAFAALYGEEAASPAETETSPLATIWTDDATRVRDHADAAPAVRLVDTLLDRALEAGASDIHIEPMADRVRVRFRIDGALSVIAEEPPHFAPAIAARIKVLADMDVANRRAAQDGRTSLAARGRPIDVRISTVPSTFGETVALRLLRRDPALLDLDKLGFSDRVRHVLDRVITLRRGIFLVTGPTGSGKTTTLYAVLERLRAHALKILSIEDPIEYFFSDVTQVQVNEDAGVSFATALRSFLRQDPDVILVGEIRDGETARIAVQAALTGHLVLSTLHTTDAASAVARLVDMGVDRYLVGATLSGVMSQRLAAQACPHCRAPRDLAGGEAAWFAELGLSPPPQTPMATGCEKCRSSGRGGRVAIAEGFLISDPIRTAFADESGIALSAALERDGFVPLLRDAARRAIDGDIPLADLRALALA